MGLPAAAEGTGACHKKSGESPAGAKGPFGEERELRKLKKNEIGKKKLLCKSCRKGKKKKSKRNPWGIVEKSERGHARQARARARSRKRLTRMETEILHIVVTSCRSCSGFQNNSKLQRPASE